MNNDTLIILPIQIYMLNNTYLRINNKHALKLILNRNKKKIIESKNPDIYRNRFGSV